jgi:hypothetical protein
MLAAVLDGYTATFGVVKISFRIAVRNVEKRGYAFNRSGD